MKRFITVVGVISVLAGLVVAVAPTVSAAASRSAAKISTRTLLGQLVVAPEHKGGYHRSRFRWWIDANGNGCNTRAEVLIAEAVVKPRVGRHCSFRGGRWFSPYDGIRTRNSSTFDVNHLVPLVEAWQSGAWRWTADTRTQYANDLGYPSSLVAVSSRSSSARGQQGPQGWLPPRRSFDCRYMARWVAVKWRWNLMVNGTEKSFLQNRLSRCGWPTVHTPPKAKIVLRTVKIGHIFFNSPGPDNRSNKSRNGEWVRLRNTTGQRRRFVGWTLSDAGYHVYHFPKGFQLAPHAAVTVHTGSGKNTASNLYWNSTVYIWNNKGDTATLTSAKGDVISQCAYSAAANPVKAC